MARTGRHKLIHVHGHDERLFDVEADPGEWNDLLGRPELEPVAASLRAAIRDRFDAERLAREGEASIRRRELIARAMARNGTRWDHQPAFDATRQYVR
jgi:choline-sulfatase